MFIWKNVGTISTHPNQRKKYKEVGLPVLRFKNSPSFFTGRATKIFLNNANGI